MLFAVLHIFCQFLRIQIKRYMVKMVIAFFSTSFCPTEMSYDDNNETDDEVDIEFDEIKTNSIQSSIDHGKILFVYQSAEMKEMLHRYGNELVLFDATYKTTKYIFFLSF